MPVTRRSDVPSLREPGFQCRDGGAGRMFLICGRDARHYTWAPITFFIA